MPSLTQNVVKFVSQLAADAWSKFQETETRMSFVLQQHRSLREKFSCALRRAERNGWQFLLRNSRISAWMDAEFLLCRIANSATTIQMFVRDLNQLERELDSQLRLLKIRPTS